MQAGWAKDAWAARVASPDLENMMTPLDGRSNRWTGLTFRPVIKPNTNPCHSHELQQNSKIRLPYIKKVDLQAIKVDKYF